MSFFFKRKNENTDKNAISSGEYERLVRKLIDGNTEIELLKASIKILQTDLDNLRGNFNRKLKGMKEEEVKEEKQETKNIYTADYLAFG